MTLADFIDGGNAPRDIDDDADQSTEIEITPSEPRFDRAPRQPETESERKAQGKQAKQGLLKFEGLVLKETIVKKLCDSGNAHHAINLDGCHTRQFVKLCNSCRSKSVYYNRCELFYCPVCAPRLANDRRKSVEWWCSQIRQPKHVVLTCRNTDTITAQKVKDFKRAFANLRRKLFAKNWRGGFYSLEVTNEGRGWHLHLHALIDAHFIPADVLAREWAKCVGQDFAIVYVKDVREGSYLNELVKYAVKGTQLASWKAEDVGAFVNAMKGQRTFSTFGTLYKQRKEHRAFLDSVQADKPACPCGCTEFRIFSEQEWEWYECKQGIPDRSLYLERRGTTSQNLPVQTEWPV